MDRALARVWSKVTSTNARLTAPDGAPPELASLMEDCFRDPPSTRPSCDDLTDRLLKALAMAHRHR
jgi:hypothetical protein